MFTNRNNRECLKFFVTKKPEKYKAFPFMLHKEKILSLLQSWKKKFVLHSEKFKTEVEGSEIKEEKKYCTAHIECTPTPLQQLSFSLYFFVRTITLSPNEGPIIQHMRKKGRLQCCFHGSRAKTRKSLAPSLWCSKNNYMRTERFL